MIKSKYLLILNEEARETSSQKQRLILAPVEAAELGI